MPRGRAKIDIVPLGDCALVIRLPDNDAAIRIQRQIEAAKIRGVIECAPACETVAVFYDGAAVESWEELAAHIRAALKQKSRVARVESRLVEIPASFEADVAIDLEHVAQHAGLSPDEVVALYCSVEYRVACIGFTPGFPYLSGLPQKLITPRRPTPRTSVPAGSIAIGAAQTGIYPIASPGGWNIIGRTSMVLFDPKNDVPAELCAGDRVRFVRLAS